MFKKITTLSAFLLLAVLWMAGCKKTEYSFGNMKTPSALSLAATVAGVDASNPNGNGTGTVTIKATATDALTYNIDFGDGKTQVEINAAYVEAHVGELAKNEDLSRFIL